MSTDIFTGGPPLRSDRRKELHQGLLDAGWQEQRLAYMLPRLSR